MNQNRIWQTLGAVLAAWISSSVQVSATNDGLADTPPMAWNCYHAFGTKPDEKMMRRATDAIVSSGLQAAGYRYVSMDDGWMAKSRDTNGNLVANSERFPSGLKALTDYIHSKGLKGRHLSYLRPGNLSKAARQPWA